VVEFRRTFWRWNDLRPIAELIAMVASGYLLEREFVEHRVRMECGTELAASEFPPRFTSKPPGTNSASTR